MAQKKGLIYRLTMGKDNLPDFTPNKLPGSRWAVFKDVFTNRLGAMAKVSLLSVLFAIPAIAWIVIMSLVKAADGTIIPYSSNLGIGYPVITNAAAIGAYRTFMYNVYTYVFAYTRAYDIRSRTRRRVPRPQTSRVGRGRFGRKHVFQRDQKELVEISVHILLFRTVAVHVYVQYPCVFRSRRDASMGSARFRSCCR